MTNRPQTNSEFLTEARLWESDEERREMEQLGFITQEGSVLDPPGPPPEESSIEKTAVHVPKVLNEAYDYSQPSSFSRALTFDAAGLSILIISGTASVDGQGQTVHAGDFRAQLWRTFRNITELLRTEEMTWHDVVRTSCYLRDIERDYEAFNEIRTAFYEWLELEPLPASTAIQARMCRTDLLVEIQAVALHWNESPPSQS